MSEEKTAPSPGELACIAWNAAYAEEHGITARNEWAASDPRGRAAWEAGAKAAQAPVAAERDKAYRERADLVAFIAAAHTDATIVYQSEDDEWPVVIIETRAGQLSWHIAKSDLGAFSALGLPVVTGEQRWDGHDTPEKYRRLSELSRIVGHSAPAWWAGADDDAPQDAARDEAGGCECGSPACRRQPGAGGDDEPFAESRRDAIDAQTLHDTPGSGQ
jgi:hypothetical protein